MRLDDLSINLPDAPHGLARFCDKLFGERVPDEECFGCEGARFDNAVLARSDQDERVFRLCLRIGGRWKVCGTVASYDPEILRLRDSFMRITDPERVRHMALSRRREAEARRKAERERQDREAWLKKRQADWGRQAREDHARHTARYGV